MKINFRKINRNKGMTLIELMVVCAIFVVISAISIFNYNKFNSSLSLQNLTDEVALSIRKVQGYAIGARGSGGGFDYPYGISFSSNTSAISSPSQKSFVIFADIASKGYTSSLNDSSCGTPSQGNECLEVLSIKSGDKISKVEYFTSSGTFSIETGSYLDILFKRPNPDAYFCYRTSISSSCESVSGIISHVKIYLQDGYSERTKTVTVWNTGQIHIN